MGFSPCESESECMSESKGERRSGWTRVWNVEFSPISFTLTLTTSNLVWSVGFEVWGLGLRVQDVGFRV